MYQLRQVFRRSLSLRTKAGVMLKFNIFAVRERTVLLRVVGRRGIRQRADRFLVELDLLARDAA
jgi:hypothetical protein